MPTVVVVAMAFAAAMAASAVEAISAVVPAAAAAAAAYDVATGGAELKGGTRKFYRSTRQTHATAGAHTANDPT